MKKLLIALAVSVVAAGAALFAAARFGLLGVDRGGATQGRVVTRAAWEPYDYQLREGPRERSYNVTAIVTVPEGASPNVRFVLDLQDRSNYYFVEMTDARARVAKVVLGSETDIGIGKPVGLKPGNNRVVLKRRHDSIEAILNDAVVARAEDEEFRGGSIGAGVLEGSASLKVGNAQKCDPIYLADDFMRTATEVGGWKTMSGTFQAAVIRNPSLSSNAFYYIGSAAGNQPGTAVGGEWFWDNYRFRTAAMSSAADDVGICFYYRDQNNYYLFRWNADKQPAGTKARKQLVKRQHGHEALLAEAPGGYQPGVWFQLEAEVVGDRIRAFIDGQQVFSVTDPGLCFGRVALYSAVTSSAGASFDDVLVQSVRGFEDDFATPSLGRWRPLGGAWGQTKQSDRYACRVTADGPAKAVTGSSRWRDYAFAADVRLPKEIVPATEAGLVSHYLDETNYVLFAWQPAAGAARLEAFVEGKRVVQEHAVVHRAPAGTRHLLAVDWNGAVATASLDGQPVASAWVTGLPQGSIGLYAAEAQGLAFENVRVNFPLPPEPVLTTHEIFSRELTMEVWAGAANDWEAASESLDGESAQLFWHRADFHGDATMEIELKGDAARAAAGSRLPRSCRMALSADAPNSVLTGYNFVLTWPDAAKGEKAYKATITRRGTAAAQRNVTLDSAVRRLRFQRQGHYIIAYANDEPILGAKDPHPLPGCRAAFAAQNIPIPRQDVAVFSDTVRVHTFSKAPADWRPAAGTWEISNRWECDPRWSFFSGVPDASALAAIWNKFAYEGDVSVEFAVGPKMETARGGTAYGY
ncbi:MAG: hypothetical protein FJ291_20945, partial [Planctomycetes bacterium]|nr:hypothetical protein [Planctomycetota bacterium]